MFIVTDMLRKVVLCRRGNRISTRQQNIVNKVAMLAIATLPSNGGFPINA